MKIAIITGASSGMGKEFAVRIAAAGETEEIWLVARREERLLALKEEIGDKASVRVFPLDLTERESVAAVAAAAEAAGAEIKYLVNAAGYGKFGSCREVGIEDAAGMIALNFRALTEMCYELIPFMTRGSRIINMSSASAFLPLENMSVYAATKAAVLSFGYSLRAELKRDGIAVTSVAPGWVDTEFALVAHNGGTTRGPRSLRPMTTPDKVVKKALRDSRRGRPVSVYGLYYKTLHLFSKIFPRRFTMMMWHAMQKKGAPAAEK